MRNPFRRSRAVSSGPTLIGDVWTESRLLMPRSGFAAAVEQVGKTWRRRLEVATRAVKVAVGVAEQRSIDSVPWDQGGPLQRGVSTERALALIPFFACVRLLADSVASLPLQAHRRLGETREPMVTQPQLVADPSAVVRPFQWKHQAVVSLATRGNAYGLVTTRDGFGFPTTIEWLHPDEVHVDESNPMRPRYLWLGRFIPREDLVHIAWFTLPGRVKGLSPVSAFAHSIGIGLHATTYGEGWFENGGQPPGKFKNASKTVNQEESEKITDRLTAKIRSGKPLVYGADWDYEALSVTPEESQFIETMKLNATQMANIFGIPPEMVGGESGGSLTYNNPEMNGLHFLKFTLRSWLVRFEDTFSTLLPERQFVRFNVDAITRADLLTRYQAHKIALETKFKSVDEVRALEDLPPLPDGQGAVITPLLSEPVTVPRHWEREYARE